MDKTIHELVIIGGGPSSLSAAIYTAREDIETLIYEKSVVGGIPATIDIIDNYPGFPDGVEGPALSEAMEKQAKRFGAKVEFGEVSLIKSDGQLKTLLVDGQEVKSKTVLIATGSSNSKLHIPGEEEYYGRGVHYCATCDGAFYRDKRLVVVGGGNSAVQESIYLTRFATHIDLLVRSSIKASEVLQNELKKLVDEGKITIHLLTTPQEIVGKDNKVVAVSVISNGEPKTIETDGVFVFVGLKPNTTFLAGSGIELDELGFIKTDQKFETSMAGVFASGDVRSGAILQIACAVGEGVAASLSISEYLHSLKNA